MGVYVRVCVYVNMCVCVCVCVYACVYAFVCVCASLPAGQSCEGRVRVHKRRRIRVVPMEVHVIIIVQPSFSVVFQISYDVALFSSRLFSHFLLFSVVSTTFVYFEIFVFHPSYPPPFPLPLAAPSPAASSPPPSPSSLPTHLNCST